MTRIDRMADGQVGYTTPWGMHIHKREFWLLGQYTVDESAQKTSQLRVYKKDGLYYVDTSLCRQIWDDVDISGKNCIFIPVQEMRFHGVMLWQRGALAKK